MTHLKDKRFCPYTLVPNHSVPTPPILVILGITVYRDIYLFIPSSTQQVFSELYLSWAQLCLKLWGYSSKQSKFKTEQNKKYTLCLYDIYILMVIGGFASPASLPMVSALWCPFGEPFSGSVMEVGLTNLCLQR